MLDHPDETPDAFPQAEEVTQLLSAMASGDQEAEDRLFRALYSQLRLMAGRMMAGQPIDHTLQPTALVSETYLRVVKGPENQFKGRGHFLSVAARAMRHLLVDHARKRRSKKRSSPGSRVGLDAVVDAFEERSQDLDRLDSALEGFANVDPEMARAIELRFFGGAGVQETAKLLGIPPRTFERRWKRARHYLRTQISS